MNNERDKNQPTQPGNPNREQQQGQKPTDLDRDRQQGGQKPGQFDQNRQHQQGSTDRDKDTTRR